MDKMVCPKINLVFTKMRLARNEKYDNKSYSGLRNAQQKCQSWKGNDGIQEIRIHERTKTYTYIQINNMLVAVGVS